MLKSFLVENNGTTVGDALSVLAQGAERVQIAVAFLSSVTPVEDWLKRGISVKLLVVLQPPTDPAVLRHLVNSFPQHLEARFYSARFNSKLFLFFKKKLPICAQVGSSNLTYAGLHTNLETNVL